MSGQKLNIAANKTKVNFIGPMEVTQKLSPDVFTVYVDGGIKHHTQIRAENFESLGDNDSHQEKKSHNHNFPPNKDQSDLKLALDHLDDSVKEIQMHGFWGGRQDHFLFNIGEILNSLKQHERTITLHGPHDTFHFYHSGVATFEPNGLFSLISLQEQNVTIEGAKYSGEIALGVLTSLGLSNHALGLVTLKHSAPLGVFITSQDSE